MKNLKHITVNQMYKVIDISSNEAVKKRLNSLGIFKDSTIYIYKILPFNGPILIKINGSIIAMRKKMFNNILLSKELGE